MNTFLYDKICLLRKICMPCASGPLSGFSLQSLLFTIGTRFNLNFWEKKKQINKNKEELLYIKHGLPGLCGKFIHSTQTLVALLISLFYFSFVFGWWWRCAAFVFWIVVILSHLGDDYSHIFSYNGYSASLFGSFRF